MKKPLGKLLIALGTVAVMFLLFLAVGYGWYWPLKLRSRDQLSDLEAFDKVCNPDHFSGCWLFEPQFWRGDSWARYGIQDMKNSFSSIQQALTTQGRYQGPIDGSPNAGILEGIHAAGFQLMYSLDATPRTGWGCIAGYFQKQGLTQTDYPFWSTEKSWPDFCNDPKAGLQAKPAWPN